MQCQRLYLRALTVLESNCKFFNKRARFMFYQLIVLLVIVMSRALPLATQVDTRHPLVPLFKAEDCGHQGEFSVTRHVLLILLWYLHVVKF